MFEKQGEITPPCGEPSVAWRRRPSSRTPAFSHLSIIRLRNIGPTHRRRLVATRLDAIQEAQEIVLQVCRIVVRRHTVDARCTILAGEPVGLFHPFQVDDVVQRRQRHTSFRSCQFSYPLSLRGQVCEAQGPLPCFPSTVLSAWHPSFLGRVPVSPVPRRHRSY